MTRLLFFLAALSLSSLAPGVSALQKLTPDKLVALHLEQALEGGPGERDIAGECATTTPARAAGVLVGSFRFVSSPASSRLTMKFGTDLYEGEDFSAEGQKVEIGYAQGRTGSRSALGIFLTANPGIVGEGLLGGVLNARWPLLDVKGRQARLNYDGLKKLEGRELHRLRYRAKARQGNLEIALFFEPESYRHVATIYTASQAQGMGLTPESSSQQSDLHFRLEEHFSEFDETSPLNLPRKWVMRYERAGNTSNEWTYEFRVQKVN
jgi:hypothetical protein